MLARGDASGPDKAVPAHIGIVMDGNGRWAKRRGLPRNAGHRKGMEAVRRTVDAAAKAGVRYLTLFGFSSENWRRPAEEINELTGLLSHYLKVEVDELIAKNVRIRVIGDKSGFGDRLARELGEAEARSAHCNGLCLVLALNYGGRDDIAQAARGLAEEAARGERDPATIGPDALAGKLYTHDMPDPDLILRTSSEHRISNFLLWQCAYAEFVFLDVLWPDFDSSHLDQALAAYAGRERRFGGVTK